MTVRDLGKNYLGVTIKLGAKGGQAYLWGGYIDDKFVETMHKVSVDYYTGLKKRLSKLSYENPKVLRERWEEMCDNRIKRGANPNIKDPEKFKIFKARRDSQIRAAKKKVKEFTSILDREIVDSYESVAEKGVVIFLYDGYEKGNYWTVKEYNNGGPINTDEEEDQMFGF